MYSKNILGRTQLRPSPTPLHPLARRQKLRETADRIPNDQGFQERSGSIYSPGSAAVFVPEKSDDR